MLLMPLAVNSAGGSMVNGADAIPVVTAAVRVGGDVVCPRLIAADVAVSVAAGRGATAPPVDAEPPVARTVGQGQVNRVVRFVNAGRQGCRGNREGRRRDVRAVGAAAGRID